MTPAEVAAKLQHFNDWRRGDGEIPPPRPREIGLAIDAAVEMIDRVAQLDPQPCFPTRDHNWYYAQGWNDCLKAALGESK